MNAIGFGASLPTGDGDRRRIDNVTFNLIGLEQAMYPKAVQTSFLNDNDFHRPFNRSLGACS